jgi:hypothetical protein
VGDKQAWVGMRRKDGLGDTVDLHFMANAADAMWFRRNLMLVCVCARTACTDEETAKVAPLIREAS